MPTNPGNMQPFYTPPVLRGALFDNSAPAVYKNSGSLGHSCIYTPQALNWQKWQHLSQHWRCMKISLPLTDFAAYLLEEGERPPPPRLRPYYRCIQNYHRQTFFLGTINCNYRYRVVLPEELISITETDLWERWQKISHYRYRFSVVFK